MTTTRVGTAAALLASLALSVSPAAAQDRSREGEQRTGRSGGERRRPKGDDNRDANRGEARGGQTDASRQPSRGQAEADRHERGQAVPRAESRDRNDGRNANRNEGNDRDRTDRDRNDRGRDDNNRDRDRGRPVVIVPPYRDNRYSSRPYYQPYYSRPRVYVAPYGYRPQGYRPGWSLNLYFGRPYGNYNSRGYYGGNYGAYSNYGYYEIPRGFAYGSLRIVDAPRDAQVFVDGYYAGIVDDYDGVFQHLNLEPGRHRIEIEVYPGQQPLEFDVDLGPGQTVTYHARY